MEHFFGHLLNWIYVLSFFVFSGNPVHSFFLVNNLVHSCNLWMKWKVYGPKNMNEISKLHITWVRLRDFLPTHTLISPYTHIKKKCCEKTKFPTIKNLPHPFPLIYILLPIKFVILFLHHVFLYCDVWCVP